MARKLTFRQLLLAILAVWRDKSHKEIAAATGLSQDSVSHHLRRQRGGEMKDDVFERILAAMQSKRGAVEIVTACLEALDALESNGDLGDEESAVIEEAALRAARLTRGFLTDVLRLSRNGPDFDDYPKIHELAAARELAGEQWEGLQDLPEERALAVVRFAKGLQNWALCERLCEEAVEAVSKNLERAASLAQLAQEIAECVRGPEGWRNRVMGFAAGHGANVLRVVGELEAAKAGLAEAKRLWTAGNDPAGVLDPGRLLHLEAALCRDQRQCAKALDLLDRAAVLSYPERALLSKGFTLEVMGEYEQAIEVFYQAAPLVEHQGRPRDRFALLYNLAVNFIHVGRHAEASELVPKARDLAVESGDDIDLVRILWLEGRLAAGLGRREEALVLLGQARREFETRKMEYNVALALLEEATLLLDEGRTAEVKALAGALPMLFGSRGVHREALAALQVFQEAVERETATAELARSVLSFLFRARYDQDLRFTVS
jgi:tetratricopeptide (TPR) repeat protein